MFLDAHPFREALVPGARARAAAEAETLCHFYQVPYKYSILWRTHLYTFTLCTSVHRVYPVVLHVLQDTSPRLCRVYHVQVKVNTLPYIWIIWVYENVWHSTLLSITAAGLGNPCPIREDLQKAEKANRDLIIQMKPPARSHRTLVLR